PENLSFSTAILNVSSGIIRAGLLQNHFRTERTRKKRLMNSLIMQRSGRALCMRTHRRIAGYCQRWTLPYSEIVAANFFLEERQLTRNGDSSVDSLTRMMHRLRRLQSVNLQRNVGRSGIHRCIMKDRSGLTTGV